LAWEALKKTINGRVNKVNTSNLPLIIRELFKDNIVRGRGLLSRGIIQAQLASPFYTSVYAALVSVLNTKFPQIGELIVKRLISSFRRSYQRNDKTNCLATTRFIAHLVNQNVVCIVYNKLKNSIPFFFLFSYMKLLHYKCLYFYLKIHRMIV
jgi:pre-mRNA-splicing factor CWC22